MGHAFARRALEQRQRAFHRVQVESLLLDVGDALPGRRWLGDLDRSLVDSGDACGLQRVQATDATGRYEEKRLGACRSLLSSVAQRVVDERAGGEHHDPDLRFQERNEML